MSAAVMQRPVRSATRPVSAARTVRTARPTRRRPNFALRRGIAALFTVTLVVLAVFAVFALQSDAAPQASRLEATVVVAPGQTVWDIAYDYAPQGRHPQAYVAEVLRYNDLDASAVAPGTLLRLPRP